jgi:membrane protein YqaA with SNARE-associated domain
MALWAFLIGLVVDSIPIFAPPAWSVLVILIISFGANPWVVVIFGVLGSTLGRYFLSLYIPHVSSKLLNHREDKNLEYVGKKLDQGYWKTSLFVLIYTLTPLSTTALFTAAGIGKANPLYILPPFAIGKFISDAIMIFTGKYAAGDIREMLHGKVSPKAIITLILGFVLLAGVLFIDWQTLFEKRKLKFRFKIWKGAGEDKSKSNAAKP